MWVEKIDWFVTKLAYLHIAIPMCKYASLVTKQPTFVWKQNSIETETSKVFDCTRWFFL